MTSWERTVLGTGLADPSSMEEAEILSPSDFTGTHRQIWAQMQILARRNGLDARSLIEALRQEGTLADAGTDMEDPNIRGEHYIANLLAQRGTRMTEYADRVLDASIRRQLRDAVGIIAAGTLTTRPSEELLDEAERSIMALRRGRIEGSQSIGDLLAIFMPRVDGMRDGSIRPAFVPDVAAVSSIVSHLEQTDFVVVAGRPGEGKSSYLRYEAYKAARRGQPVIVFNLENDPSEYAKSAISLHTSIDSNKLRNPRMLTPQEMERVRAAAHELAALPLHIVSLGGPSITEMERILRKMMQSVRPALVQVDYVQLINNGLENKVADVSLSTAALRAWAMPNRFHIPVMAAAQLNRQIEGRGLNANPQLSDLRESGSLEQDATGVWFVRNVWSGAENRDQIRQFQENVNPDGTLATVRRAVPVRFHVLKSRNSPTGVSEMVKWTKSTGAFQTLVEDVQ